jgi:hypothetical protein
MNWAYTVAWLLETGSAHTTLVWKSQESDLLKNQVKGLRITLRRLGSG